MINLGLQEFIRDMESMQQKNYLIRPSLLKGKIKIPPSKSQTLRAILFASLASGESMIHNYLPSPDTFHMIEACRLLGAKIDTSPTSIKIIGLNGKISGAEDVINAGNSGIILRFLTAIAALSDQFIIITGDHSIRHQRPMQPLLDSLNELGASAYSSRDNGFAPVIVKGPLINEQTTVMGHDSQAVSALLIASCFANNPIRINVKNPGEKPWVLLTLDWLDRLKVPYKNNQFNDYQVFGPCRYEGFTYSIPGDLSSAAFPIAAALVTQSEIQLQNVNMDDLQGDKELIYLFQKMGASIEIDSFNQTLLVKKAKKLSGVEVDINHFIDAITILAVVACYAEGTTHIKNAAVAKEKECNRISAITMELKKMGANIEETEDGLIIKKSALKGSYVNSHDDHRMCMSLAVAALGAEGKTYVSGIECVSKTFPSFLKDFQSIFAKIEKISMKE